MALSSVMKQLRRLRADERGAVSITMGILMIPLVGFLALGYEVSNWYMITRSMQNASDAAALAAAINNGANYDVEARAVASQYGFTNGVNNVTVGVSNTATCPSTGTKNCYSVTINGYTPLLMSQVVGFQGAGNINGSLQKQLGALAVAQGGIDNVCLLALAGSGTTPAIRTNGAPTGNMNGCNSMSNTAAQCNGHDLGLGISYAVGSNNGCGGQQQPNPVALDPYYSQINGNIQSFPSNPCPSPPPQETHHGNSTTIASVANQLSGPLPLAPGNNIFCGDQVLYGNVTVTTGGGSAVMIIVNGQLDLNGHEFRTAPGAALTIVFTGSDCCGYIHAPNDSTNSPNSVLDVTAPTTGPWAGMAIVQDPNLRTGLDVSQAGNSPQLLITGLIYMPHASLTLKGAINKSTNGDKCVVMVADNFQISGTGGILQTDIGHCAAAGLNMPHVQNSAKLVL